MADSPSSVRIKVRLIQNIDVGPLREPTPTEKARIASAFREAARMEIVTSIMRATLPATEALGDLNVLDFKMRLVSAFLINGLRSKFGAERADYSNVPLDPWFPQDQHSIDTTTAIFRSSGTSNVYQRCYDIAMNLVKNIADEVQNEVDEKDSRAGTPTNETDGTNETDEQ